MEVRYCFGVTHTGPELEAYTRARLEAAGCTVTLTVTFETHHRFELHTLTAVEPKKLNPLKFTRAGDL